MKVLRTGQPMETPSEHPLFDGTAYIRSLAGDGQLRVNEVTFSPGARTKWHRHSFEQILLITDGRGIVATDDTEYHVVPGDVVIIPVGERHWHGAEADASMTHVSVNGVGETEW